MGAVIIKVKAAAAALFIIISVFLLSCGEAAYDALSVFLAYDGPAELYPPDHGLGAVRGVAADKKAQPESDDMTVKTITLSFVGDCMLASYRGRNNWNTFNYYADAEPLEYFFAGAAGIFRNDDFTIANCENVFTDRDLYERGKIGEEVYWYKSKAANAGIFSAGGVDIISLANNHTLDYGEEGKEDTVAAAEAASLIWGDDGKPVIIEKYGFRIALVCATFFKAEYVDTAAAEIKKLSESTDFQIVYFHGGPNLSHEPSPLIINYARRMVDAGADLVLGAHPHVLQPIESYKGVNIVYSLGNFIFGAGRGENRTIIYQYKLEVAGGLLFGQSDNIIPCYVYVDRWQPAPVDDERQCGRVIDFLYGRAESPL